ncbi:hypothetical protein B0O99DRAFT_184292 [Bisporella sp. PMI_857]|nr:hypothetical protein B0O99DRAFT_184292 [Bisporella sp. PMI_857]
MSRTSAKTSSSNQNNTSPTTSTPPLSLSRETTNASIESVPSFGASAIDDFVLFPEDSASWNPADMSMPDLDPHFDLNHFSFDINDINPTSNYADYPLDFTSSFSHLAAHEPTHTTFNANQYSLSQWDEALASQSATNTKPFESLQSTDGLGSSWSFGDTSGLEFFDSSASGGSLTSAGQTPQNSSSSNASPVSASNLDWAINDLASFRDFSPDLNRGTFVAEGLIVKEPATPRSPAAIQRLVDSVPSYSSELQTFVDPSDHVHQTETPDKLRSDNHYPTDGYGGQGQGSNKPTETLEVENACAIVTLSLKALDSAPPGYSTLTTKLRSLQDVLQNVHRLEGILPESVASSIQNLSTELDRHFAHPCEPHHAVVPVLQEAAEQCIIKTRMLVQLPSVNRRSQAQSSSAVSSDSKSCSPLSCPWENQEDASSDTPDRHQSRATVDHLTQIISGSSRLYGSLSSVNHIPDAPKGIHLQDDAIHLSSVVTGLQIPSTPATQGISVMPPHHLFLNKIAIDASNPPGSSILQHSLSKEDSSRHNLVTTQTIAQKPLFRFDHNSPRPSLSSQPSIYALAGASLFEPVLTKTVGSSTNTSLLVREEYAWGAIPQAVREQAILPVGRNNLYDQLLEGGERRNITPSLTTISAARPAVPVSTASLTIQFGILLLFVMLTHNRVFKQCFLK